VRFHDLRHTCASHLVSGTWGRAWRLEEVRDYLGHSNISVTQRYAHMSPHAMRSRPLPASTEWTREPQSSPPNP
jgi:integrase